MGVVNVIGQQATRAASAAIPVLLIWSIAWFLVWFGTDYRFANLLLERVQWGMPLLLLLASSAVLWMPGARRVPRRRRPWLGWLGLVVGASLTLVVCVLVLETAAAMAFYGDPADRATLLQRVSSPAGDKVATVVYCGPALAIQSEGTLVVTVRYLVSGTPLVERTVYAQYIHDVVVQTERSTVTSFVRWRDDETLASALAHALITLTPVHATVRSWP